MKHKGRFKRWLALAVSGVMLCMAEGALPGEAPDVTVTIRAEAAGTYVPRTTEPSRSDPNYTTGNVYYNYGYGMPNCTCYAYGRAKELLGTEPALSHGYAYEWWGYNINTGAYSYGTEPKLGAIACWSTGHVAVVEAIEGDTVWISESSYPNDYYPNGIYFQYTPNNRNAMGTGFQGYIYIGDWSNNQAPIGWLDKVEGGDGKLYVKGWAFDPDEPEKQIMVHIYVGGSLGSDASSHAILANSKRQDVDDVYHCGAYHGFEGTIYPPKSGDLEIYAYAIDAEGGANPELSGCPLNATISADTETPVIGNVEITDISSTGYTITCDVSDNIGINKVEFPTWTSNKDQDDLIWHKGTVKDGKATFRLETKDHQKQSGEYITHIYAYDYAGNSVCKKLDPIHVPNPITNIRVKDIDKTGYTILCDVDEDWGAVKIQFPTWTDKNAQDDLIWHNGTLKNNSSTFRVKASEHNGETGIYITHIYVYDAAGNACCIAVPGVNVNLRGDVNANGAFNVVDLLLVQKWLLAVPYTELTDPVAADMNADGIIDVFDLALMKRVLLQK